MKNHIIHKVLKQVFIKTLRFGTVILYKIKVSNTLDEVMKQARTKIDRKFEGYGIEFLLTQEKHLQYQGRPIEGSAKLSDFNVQEGDTLRVSGYKSKGGAPKKKRKDNPFATEAPKMTQEGDMKHFEASFTTALAISKMDSVDPLVTIQGRTIEHHLFLICRRRGC